MRDVDGVPERKADKRERKGRQVGERRGGRGNAEEQGMG